MNWLNKTYTMLSEKVLYTESTDNCGISFQNAYSDSSSTTPAYKNTNNDYSAQDYATSNVRSYLKGNTVQRGYTSANYVYSPSGASVNLMTTYNLANDKMYNKIQERTLTSLYTNMGISYYGKIWSATDNDGKTDKTNDKLWLLSATEMKEIFNADYVPGNNEGPNVYMSSRTSVLNASSADSWWGRTIDMGSANCVNYMDSNGEFRDGSAYSTYSGVRPAFLF